ncbi:carbohydrate ABC transporter permease [Falsiroseomonas sp. CW058]|uniref:carbohydrate ABC transporter permease n=1 Tax=Falsiroseomonas sp. CW058 TaxID=3388664 RepID=UPI003D315202
MRETAWTRLGLIAPAQAMVFAVIVVPAAWLLWLSLNTSSFGTGTVFVGLANYARILADPFFWRALWNTALVVLVVVHAELLLGLGMALLFAHGLPMKRLMLAIVLAPYAVSEVAAVVMWRYLFDPEVGHVAYLLGLLGLPSLEYAVVPSHGLVLVSLLSTWLHLPFTFMILYAARLALPVELYEAARIDGAGPWQTFRRVTLPLLVPAILVAALFRLIFAFRLFGEVWLLTEGGPARTTEVVAVYLYLEAFRYNAFGAAAATGWLMVVGSLILAAPYLWRLARAQADDAK